MRSTIKIGRPLVTNDAAVVRILLVCLRNGLSVRQACVEAGISHEAYYRRIRLDKAFADNMTAARQALAMSAKVNISKSIASGDVATSKWLLDKEGFGGEVGHIVRMIGRLDKHDLEELAKIIQNDRAITNKLNI